MAAYRQLANQVFNKSAIASKYNGSIDDFKKEFNWGSINDQEDEHLLVISKMNFDEFDGDGTFIKAGLDLNDFVLIGRYGNYRETDWLIDAGEFFWHIKEDEEISHYSAWIDEYTVDEILDRFGGFGKMLEAINNRSFERAKNPAIRTK